MTTHSSISVKVIPVNVGYCHSAVKETMLRNVAQYNCEKSNYSSLLQDKDSFVPQH